MLLGLRIALPIGLAAHMSYFFFDKLVVGEFDSYDILWGTGFAIASDRPEGWDYMYTLINGIWFFGLAFGIVASFLLTKPAEEIVRVSSPNATIPPGIDN